MAEKKEKSEAPEDGLHLINERLRSILMVYNLFAAIVRRGAGQGWRTS